VREPALKTSLLESERTKIKMNKAEQYRQIAAECQDRAERAHDHDDQLEWNHLAEQWLDLAQQAEPDDQPD